MEHSTIYGPVQSWRLGRSLGVDLLLRNSICSFDCAYCQLGRIQEHTAQREVFVPTAQVLADLESSRWAEADVVTFSGSGEPTLALNLGQCVRALRERTGKPAIVLTNGTLLGDPAVRAALAAADRVFVKLDAASDRTLRAMNAPVPGVSVASILAGILALREEYRGHLAIQTMLMPANLPELDALCELYRQIRPEEVQLNTPLRPVPRGWYVGARGNHQGAAPVAESVVKVITREQAQAVEQRVRERAGVPVVSVYRAESA